MMIMMRSSWTQNGSAIFLTTVRRFALRDDAILRIARTGRAMSILSRALQNRIDEMVKRHAQLMDEMKSPGYSSPNTGKELSALSAMAALHQKLSDLVEEEQSVQDLLQEAQSSKDSDLESECQKELRQIEERRRIVENRMIDQALPRDEDDYESDAIIEVRSGTGGDEASLFAAELFQCYTKTAGAQGWKAEILSESRTEIGGLREASLSVSGGATYSLAKDADGDDDDDNSVLLGPFGYFKYESGTHRVQRVPINDSKIHTSAASVAVLPSASNNSKSGEPLPSSELKIETMRSSGAGGQHTNTTDSAVRITHIPTGITASIQDERSQHKNKEKALKLITARVRDRQRAEEERTRGETKSNLLGGGDRSERIRTYNWPQDRVTDHRSKSTQHGVDALLSGQVEGGLVATFLPELRLLRREELLENLKNEDACRK